MSNVMPVLIPRENVNDESVTLVSWLVKDGDQVSSGQDLAEVEGSKSVFEIAAPQDGYVRVSRRVGDEIDVGTVLCHICDTADAEISDTVADDSVAGDPVVGNGASGAARFSRKALQLLSEHGLSEKVFEGRGLVRSGDILEHIGQSPPQSIASPASSSAVTAHVSPVVPALDVPFKTERLSRQKRTEARYIASAYHNTLQSAVTVAIPTSGLRAAADLHPYLQGNTTAVIVYEAARLLRKYPAFNAFHSDGTVNTYEHVNIGVAIDAGQSLKVPVIRGADTKSISEIADELRESLVAYLNDEMSPESLAGGTFTISDLSAEGVYTFHPLINQGQSGILGIGAEFFPPGSGEGTFQLVLTFDHQVAEGRLAAQFLGDLRGRLEAYESAIGQSVGAVQDEEPYCSRCLTPIGRLRDMNQYLVQVVKPDGSPGHLCTVCLQGW